MKNKIDLRLLSSVLNPAILVILVGGLLLNVNTTVLILIGVLGYSIWGVINILAHRQEKREREEMMNRKKKKRKKQS